MPAMPACITVSITWNSPAPSCTNAATDALTLEVHIGGANHHRSYRSTHRIAILHRCRERRQWFASDYIARKNAAESLRRIDLLNVKLTPVD